MAKNYTAIHYISEALKGFDEKFVDKVIRGFNLIDSTKESNGCFSNSAILYIIAKKFGYEPEICFGLCELAGREFYHVWIEIDKTVIDLAVYGNVNFSPLSLWDFELITPYIGDYKNAPVVYRKNYFDKDWERTEISEFYGKTLEEYMDFLPNNVMWRILCKYMDITFTKQIINDYRQYCKDVVLGKIK